MKTIMTLCALAISGALTLQAADGVKVKKPHEIKAGEGKHTPEEIFKKLDTNNDGFLSKDEFMASPRAKEHPEKAAEHFAKMDKKGTGKITLEEFKAGHEHKKHGGDNK